MNFKRDLNLLENLVNSPKFFLDLIFRKVNLVGITYMQEFELQYNCQTAWFKKIKEFEFEIQTLQPLMYNPILQGFHSIF
jgi:hypothetical protein